MQEQNLHDSLTGNVHRKKVTNGSKSFPDQEAATNSNIDNTASSNINANNSNIITLATINPRIVEAEYAVRGKLSVEAERLSIVRKSLKKPS